MATKTLTSTTNINQYGSATTGTGVYTITYPKSSINITGSTFTVDELFPTGVTTKMTWTNLFAGSSGIGFYFPHKTGTGNAYVNYRVDCPLQISQTWNNGSTKTLQRTGGASATFNTADYFNSSNPTDRTYSITYEINPLMTRNSTPIWTHVMDSGPYDECYNVGWSTVSLSQTLVLDVPPTATVSAISYDTGFIYAGLTTASVTISGSTAYYDGTITASEFTIGNQTATGLGDGTLSIALTEGGTFTPTVTVTDSRGQTYIETFAPITVNVYTAPSVSISVDRTDASGNPDDEGTYGLIEATLTFSDTVASAIAPSVVLTDENGTETTPVVTWYTDDTLSTTVTWSSVASNDTVYGLFSGLNTQYAYNVAVRPRDSKGTGTAISETISAAFYTVDFLGGAPGVGGHGIAFGQPASQTGFYCNMDAHFVDANSTMRALFDFVYPVGSYYETSDTTFDPNVTWGGTWSLETEGQVHVSAGANYKISGALTDTTDGGEETHTLIVDEIPSHTHDLTYAQYNRGTGNVTASALQYSGSTATTTATGGGDPHNNMQPYIIVNRWHRTA